MKRLFSAFVLAVSSCASWGQTPHFPMEHLLWKGNALPFYGQPSSAESKRLLELLQRSNLAERMASQLERSGLVVVPLYDAGDQWRVFWPCEVEP